MDAKWIQLLVLLVIVVGLAATLVLAAKADARRFKDDAKLKADARRTCGGYQPVPKHSTRMDYRRSEFERAVLANTDYVSAELHEARCGEGYGGYPEIECMWQGWQLAIDATAHQGQPYDKHWGPLAPPKTP